MGYVYTLGGQLCCDICGSSVGVRKRYCTYNWCQPTAVCSACKGVRISHKACKRAAEDFDKKQNKQAQLLAQGEYVRTSAIGEGDGMVNVTFRNSENDALDILMTSDEYNAIPLLEPATPADYGKDA